jgi:hypothetical protein
MPEPMIPTMIAKAASALQGGGSDAKAGAKAEAKKAARTRFEGVWERIRDELLKHFASEGMPQDAQDWFKEVCYPYVLV